MNISPEVKESLNPIVLSIPIFFILIGIELVVERLSHRQLYRFPDAIANLSCGITSQASVSSCEFLALESMRLFSNFALFQLEKKTDLLGSSIFPIWTAYYWAHRMSHEINLFWAAM